MGARDEEKVRHSLTAGGPRRMGEVMSGRFFNYGHFGPVDF